jgi:hypothetical protein
MSKAPDGVDPDRLNVVARRVLLDGLNALRPHLRAITVVGAQAVYLRTPGAAVASAAYTSDGDLSIDPMLLGDEPLVNEALAARRSPPPAASSPPKVDTGRPHEPVPQLWP